MIILPDTDAGALHAVWRVAAFPSLQSMSRPATVTLMTLNTDRNGIIRLTFTA